VKLQLPEDRRRRRLVLVAIAAAIAAGYYLISRVIPHDDLQQLLEDVSNTLGAWTYLLVGVFAFAETGAFVGLVVPGETVMLLGGAVAGQGAIDVYILIAIAWFAAWAGDTTSFLFGRRLGREFVMRHGPRFGLSAERFEGVEDYFSRHGGKTIFIGRFVGIVRALAPFIAGSSGMRYRAFVPYSVLGTGIWASAHILIGYIFSRSIDSAAKYAGRGAFLLGTLIAITVGSVFLYRRLRVAENRRAVVRWMDNHAVARWLVVLGRRFQPQLRFLWDRVTPGGTFGLEFTSLMAVLAVGAFVLVAYTSIVSGDAGPTPGDQTAIDIVESLRTGWLVDVAKVVTALGAGALVYSLAAVCALALVARRRWAEVGVLLAGLALVYVGVHELKDAVDRPRPAGGLVDAEGSSFPSAHAAYSTFYVWLAVTIVMRLRVGMARGALVIAAGIVATALVGLARVYLGVHYMSDVNAGWALGAAAFSLCAAIALVVSTLRTSDWPLRQNGDSAAAARPAEDRK
jgi:membrane protein DedA with SNARE-associated domain/membrane-associated phospholipid phosphatase